MKLFKKVILVSLIGLVVASSASAQFNPPSLWKLLNNILSPMSSSWGLSVGTQSITGGTITGNIFNVIDGDIQIYKDGANNLTFEDTVTGTKTLAQLAAGGGGITDHNLLNNLNWANAGHTIDTQLDVQNNDILFTGITTPANPAATKLKVYAISSGGTYKLATLDSVGTETILGAGGGGTPGGLDTQVQFNDGGSFGGDAGLLYDKITETLTTTTIRASELISQFLYTEDADSATDINIIAGNALTGNTPGGAMTFITGVGSGNASGGSLAFNLGQGGDTGSGGGLSFVGGAGGVTSGSGGSVEFRGGSATAGDSNGGNVYFITGAGTGTGIPGSFYFDSGNAGNYGLFDFSALSGGNKIYTWINQTGTVALSENTVNLTGDQSVAGIKTFSSIPVLPGVDPTSDNEAVRKSYVDAIAQGLTPKSASRVATTTAGVLLTDFENGDTIDGVVLATGDRILIKNEVVQSTNGIYTVNASGAPTRATDYDADAEVKQGTFTFISAGTVNMGYTFVQTTINPTLGVDDLVFVPLSSQQTYTASLGTELVGADFRADLLATGAIGLTGNELKVNVDNSSIEIATNALQVKALGITNAMLAGSIADTKLNTISTAGKVSGAAFTSLSSIPGAAGIIPIANLASGTPDGTKFVRDDGTLATPAGGGGASDFTYSDFCFHCTSATNAVFTNLPAAEGEFTGTTLTRIKVNLTGATQYRIMVNQAVAGFAGSDLNIEYSTDNVNFINLDTAGAGEVDVGTGTGVKVGVFNDIVAGGKQDVWLRIVGKQGDGVVDPSFRQIVIQVKFNSTIVDGSASDTVYKEIQIIATAAANSAWTNMPAAATEFLGSALAGRHKIDLSNVTHYRIVVNQAVAGLAGADLNLQYSTNDSTFNAADTGGAGELDVGTGTGVKVGAWAPIVSGANDDVWIRLVGKQGDGVVDPAWRFVSIQFLERTFGQGVAGSDTQVLYNDTNATGADSGFTFNETTNIATLAGGLAIGLGGTINWNSGDVIETHSANALTFTGATSGYSFDDDILLPTSGSVINFNAGDVTITHSANLLTLAGGNLSLDDNNITNVGDIALDSITPDATNININIGAGALNIGDGTYAFGHTPMVGIEGILEVDGVSYFDGNVFLPTSQMAAGATSAGYARILAKEKAHVISVPAYTGSGLNDMTAGTGFTGLVDENFTVEITGHNITAVADAGSGRITVSTPNTRGLSGGNFITIAGTTSYNGNYTVISVITDTSFVVSKAYTTSQTGNWIRVDNLITPAANYFNWYNGAVWTTGVKMIATPAYFLDNGATISFGAIFGHAFDDQWTFTASAGWSPFIAQNSAGSELFRIDPNDSVVINGAASATSTFYLKGSSLDLLYGIGDVLTFAGTNQFNNTITVGVDDTGYDVQYFGATSGKSWLWDESANKMIVTGDSSITGTMLFTGAFTVEGATVFNDTSADVDFRIESDTNANMFTLDAGLDAVGIGVVPNAAVSLDMISGFASRWGSFNASNGANNNIAIGDFSYIRITGPSGVFNITGIATPTDGKAVILFNDTAQNMTITNNSGSSSAANRIYTLTGGDIATVGTGSVYMVYSAATAGGVGGWIVIAGLAQ